MNKFPCRFVIVCTCLATAGLSSCGGSPDKADALPQGVAALVGKEPIREANVQARLNATTYAGPGGARRYGPPHYSACVDPQRAQGSDPNTTIRAECKAEYEIARAVAVNALVRAKWISREASRRGIDSERLADQAIGKLRRLRTQLSVSAQRQAAKIAPLDKQRPTLRLDLQERHLLLSMPLTNLEIVDYGKANAQIFLDSETRVAEIVQMSTKADAVLARKRLAANEPWHAIQQAYGIKPFSLHWTGKQTIKEQSAPHDAFGRSLFAAKPHQLIGPVHSLNGWFVFEVLRVVPPRYAGLSPRDRSAIVHTLRTKKLATLLRRHYAKHTTCANEYRIPEAPSCV